MKQQHTNTYFDLLSTVETGGCSAKLSPGQLSQILSELPIINDPRIMVDIQTHDDAGVYRLNDQTALIVTTDFFPPVCSDAFEFGQIAAANALSDVYAMGGTPLLVLNLMMFPATGIPLEVFGEIMRGGQQKTAEAGALVMGGHTINDAVPKYGLAVVGTVPPDHLITNAGTRAGQKLILTKPLGSGILMAAHRMQMHQPDAYQMALDNMKQLNNTAKEIMQKYHVSGATDITGFGLAGHAMQMANAGSVSFVIHPDALPLLPQVTELIDLGCIPGAVWRNHDYTHNLVQYNNPENLMHQAICCDAQTSGGLLFAVDANKADAAITDLQANGHALATIIGEVTERHEKAIYFK
ncbi:selenophosphate synthase [Breznakibacter xylanolyticus]|uniref:Selenide, water dikinase n=1 Tax=Breznakibacter xylanolyticus TaxID=990 RepID=A0A2W7N5E4_9BACT|nr:selenide, water dikinase SelD [Breznakibacter xylanolyticus]PZX15301.1 selenophosphate synthase [Breznakibacter xylanolyticus]